jgi:hypothetical protein
MQGIQGTQGPQGSQGTFGSVVSTDVSFERRLTVEGPDSRLTVVGDSFLGSTTSATQATFTDLIVNGTSTLRGATYLQNGLNMVGGVVTGNLSLGSQGALQIANRTTNGVSFPAPVRYSFNNYDASTRNYKLGRWTASQNGKMLKLTLVTCNNGYNMVSRGNTIAAPLVGETVVLFHTSNGFDYQQTTPNTSPFLPRNRCYGWGWAYSLHANTPIKGLYVVPVPLQITQFDFYVSLEGYSGQPLVEALTTETWQQSVEGPLASLPGSGHVTLQIAAVQTTMTPATSYRTTPLIPFFTLM